MPELYPIKVSELPVDNSLTTGDLVMGKGDNLHKVGLKEVLESPRGTVKAANDAGNKPIPDNADRFIFLNSQNNTLAYINSNQLTDWIVSNIPFSGTWETLGGDQSSISLSGFTNDLPNPTVEWSDIQGDQKDVNLMEFTDGTIEAESYSFPSTEPNSWRSVAFGNGIFVAVSSTGSNRVMTSTDGENWTAVSVTSQDWRSVAFGNGLFVAVSSDGSNRVMTSIDGEDWTLRTSYDESWSKVKFINNTFVAVSNVLSARLMHSDDGITWYTKVIPSHRWNDISYGNGVYVIVCFDYRSTHSIMTSSDLNTWSYSTGLVDFYPTSITFGNGVFVTVSYGYYTQNDIVLTSKDGVNWTREYSPENNSKTDICFGNGVFLAVCSGGDARIIISENGKDWHAFITPEQSQLSAVTYGQDKFVAVASIGTNRVLNIDVNLIKFENQFNEVQTSDGTPIPIVNKVLKLPESTPLENEEYTVSTLPSTPTRGQKAFITDATSPTYLGVAVGGGSVFCEVMYNGTDWVTI